MPGPGHCGDPPLSVVGSLVPAAVLAPVAAAVADRRSPVVLLAGGYLVQAAANVVMGWLEAAGIMTAGLLVGVLISLGGVGSVFAVCACLGVVAALLVATIRAIARAVAGGGCSGVAG
jgi:hypothetical protein